MWVFAPQGGIPTMSHRWTVSADYLQKGHSMSSDQDNAARIRSLYDDRGRRHANSGTVRGCRRATSG